jgi:hypothetical protein
MANIARVGGGLKAAPVFELAGSNWAVPRWSTPVDGSQYAERALRLDTIYSEIEHDTVIIREPIPASVLDGVGTSPDHKYQVECRPEIKRRVPPKS